jgi:hypothetical protein
MQTTEHILLESDDREIPALRQARKVHADVELRSRLRRRVLQLKVIDYYYLAVRSRSRSAVLEYVIDLRFVATPPLLSRRIAWRWITASLVLLALITGIAVHIGSSATPWWRHDWLRACAAVTGLWAVTTLIAAYRTTETVRLLSTHGRATLLAFTGGIGTFHVARHFLTQLAAHLRLASGACRPTRAEHLRDEMREHQRLRDIGVLVAAEYEASKVRILAEHSKPARRP